MAAPSLLNMVNNNGRSGLEYAQNYAYEPNVFQKLLDVMPGIGGKRDYDRAEKYRKSVHWNPEDVESRIKQGQRGTDISGKTSRLIREEDDITTKNIWHQRMLSQNIEDPRNFGYKNMLERDDITDINQYIIGTPSGHIMETDDTEDYSVDPYNIVKASRDYSGVLGKFGIPRYSGSIRENPGIDPYVNPEYFRNQIAEVGFGSRR